MKLSCKILGAVAGSVAMMSVASQAQAAITFLHHFDSSSDWDINATNGDYSAGDTTASLIGTPGSAAGVFGSQSPNGAYHATGVTQGIDFDANTGAVDLADPHSGGITVGAWVKLTGTGYLNAQVFRIGYPDFGDDFLSVDYADGFALSPRVVFNEGGNTTSLVASAISASDWIYLAATVDLTNAKLGFHVYNSAGTQAYSNETSITIGAGGWNAGISDSSLVRINGRLGAGVSDFWLDEFSIDNRVLTNGEIAERVAGMVAGNPLVVPEPATGLLLLAGGALIGRRRRA